MAVVAKGSIGGEGDYSQPPTGIVPALCIDVIDLGYQNGPYGTKHKIQLVWQIGGLDDDGQPYMRDDGKPFRIKKYYTLSLNEKATLRTDLESWRGKPFDDAELQDGFDVEQLLGIMCQLHLFAKPSKKYEGKTFVDVKSVLPRDRRAGTITKHPEYLREKDIAGGQDIRSPKAPNGGGSAAAPGRQPATAGGSNTTPWENEEDDDLPF